MNEKVVDEDKMKLFVLREICLFYRQVCIMFYNTREIEKHNLLMFAALDVTSFSFLNRRKELYHCKISKSYAR